MHKKKPIGSMELFYMGKEIKLRNKQNYYNNTFCEMVEFNCIFTEKVDHNKNTNKIVKTVQFLQFCSFAIFVRH